MTQHFGLMNTQRSADEVQKLLNLKPHPEGGWYRETFRDDPATPGGRGAVTAIYFLLAAGEQSALHRVDATEIWLWQAGAALALTIGEQTIRLGPNFEHDETLQAVVPAHVWQAARSIGDWTLVSCIVAPAFSFSGFELADPSIQI